jgi:hypothetical protein
MPKLPVADGASAGKIGIMMTSAATKTMIVADIPVAMTTAVEAKLIVTDILAVAGMTTTAAPAVMRTTTGVVPRRLVRRSPRTRGRCPQGVG